MAVRKEHFKVGKWFLKQEAGFEQSGAESQRRAKAHTLSGLAQDVDRSVAAGNDSSYMIFTTKSQTLAPVEGEVLFFFKVWLVLKLFSLGQRGHHNAMMLSQLWVLNHLPPLRGDLSVTQRHPQWGSVVSVHP